MIFGNWKVGRTVLACLLFGAATALQFQLPAMGIDVPTAFLIMLPYLLALLAVAGLVGRQMPPAALTLPYAVPGRGKYGGRRSGKISAASVPAHSSADREERSSGPLAG